MSKKLLIGIIVVFVDSSGDKNAYIDCERPNSGLDILDMDGYEKEN